MSEPYEQPTMEFRQLKKPIKQDNGICGPGYREWVVGYETTVQQKWAVEFEHELGFKALRYEWKDLPVVDSKDAK